jgi:hypothetical protein
MSKVNRHRRPAPLALSAAVVVLAVLAAWSTALSPQPAGAVGVKVGLDFDPTGTPANGVYNPSALPVFETCREVALGQQVSIDVFVEDITTLAAFSSHILYDQTKVTAVSTNVSLFMQSQVGSSMVNDSTPLPEPSSDGIVEIAGHDEGNISGDSGYGVLGRITFSGAAMGSSPVQIPSLDLNSDGTLDTGVVLRQANGALVNDNPAVYSPGVTLSAAMNSSQATFTYSSTGDPVGVSDMVQIDSEVMAVTGVNTSTNTANVIRGQNGTTPASHSNSSVVRWIDGFYDGPWNPGPGNPAGTIVVYQDTDGDGFKSHVCSGIPDNCPNVANVSQADLDLDGQGDACDGDIDGDHFWNNVVTVPAHEQTMGSNQNNGSSTPEVCDGTDNDADGSTDEGYDYNSNLTPDCSDTAADTDSDSLNNTVDTDDDGDGTLDTREVFAGTNSLKKCSVTTSDNFWLPDNNNSKSVNISDVVRYGPYFNSQHGTHSPTPGAADIKYNRRFDLNSDNRVNISDVVLIGPVMNTSCTP